MENILRVYYGPHISGVGNPILVETGWSQPRGRIFSEFFLIFKNDDQFFSNLRAGYEYSTPAPHPVKLDVKYLMEKTYEAGEEAMYNYLDQFFQTRGIRNPFYPVELKESPSSLLTRMYLFGVHVSELRRIRQDTKSPKLIVFLDKLFKFPPFSQVN